VEKIKLIFFSVFAGAESFLATEYQYLLIFMSIFSVIIFVFLSSVGGFNLERVPCEYDTTQECPSTVAYAFFTTVAFILGALTSTLSGYLGMKIATYANARTTLEARRSVGRAFIVAFRSGSVMGFLLAANGLLVLFLTILVFKLFFKDDWVGLYEAITGYGLGGGIYTKAADVGADLVGKIEQNIPEDDPRNPAVSVA
jgi:inorganic pyrophosphatase